MVLMAFPQLIYTSAIFIHTIIAVKSSTNPALCHYVAGISFVIIAARNAYKLNILCHLFISYRCLNLTMCKQKIKTSIMKVKELAHG
jgi:hypothetical protein